VVLDDSTARIEVTLFSEAYEEFRELLTTDKILVVTGNLNYDEYRGGLSIRADQVLEFEQARSLYARALQLDSMHMNGAVKPAMLQELQGILSTYLGGNCNIRLRMVDKILVVTGNLNYDEYRGGLSIRVDQVLEFEQARSLYARALQLDSMHMNGAMKPAMLQELQGILSTYLGGNCNIRLRMVSDGSSGIVEFGDAWRVNPTDELIRRLERLFACDGVRVMYGSSGS